ncbi:MAG: DUF4959 domain-containing protein [Tannerella sp.]|jgi:hypothetical protein|nr:DUF4959 domain-containing protein [Tannerella sp.]
MTNIIFLTRTLCFIAALLIVGCSAEERHLPISSDNGKPAPVSNASATAIPGGAILSYRIPDTDDLLAVKAVYTVGNGKQREVMASYFIDTLTVEGFTDTGQHEAMLYTVSRSQQLSEPVTVSFTPLESPLSKIKKTVRIFPDFGGATFKWKNEDRALFVFDLLVEDANGYMVSTKVFQNKVDSMEYTVRGYEPTPKKFALNITDRWGNESGLIYPDGGSLTPVREDRLDKSAMRFMHLNGDSGFNIWGGMDIFMIDDDLNTFGHSTPYDWPPYITIDLGRKAKLSRIVINQRMFQNMYYNGANWSIFDVYCCNTDNRPSQSVEMSEWNYIMNCKIEKPSGMALNECTNEDLRQARAGDSFAFPREMPPVRYVRICVTQTWGFFNYSFNSEVSFYGSYAD